MQDEHESSHPAHQLSDSTEELGTYLNRSHSALPIQEAGRNHQSRSGHTVPIRGGSHHDTPNMSTSYSPPKARMRGLNRKYNRQDRLMVS